LEGGTVAQRPIRAVIRAVKTTEQGVQMHGVQGGASCWSTVFGLVTAAASKLLLG